MIKIVNNLVWVLCGMCLTVILYENDTDMYDQGYDDGYADRWANDSVICEMRMQVQKNGFDRAMDIQAYMCNMTNKMYTE